MEKFLNYHSINMHKKAISGWMKMSWLYQQLQKYQNASCCSSKLAQEDT